MLQWRADETRRRPSAEAGLPFVMLRTTEEFMKELQFTEVTLKRASDQSGEDRRKRPGTFQAWGQDSSGWSASTRDGPRDRRIRYW